MSKTKTFQATEKLFTGHNLVSNRFPKGLPLERFNDAHIKRQHDLSKFGLWDTSSPDFSKYYPEVKPEDLTPADEDFIYPIYRGLSEVVVNKYGPIDFSQGGVLKASMTKIIGQTIYPNHDANVGNQLGAVADAVWQESYKVDGVKIPAGFNVRLKIDGKSNPSTARGIMMDPPSIHSTSVGVTYMWEKSHPDLGDDDFWQKLGTFDKKGQLIRRVVIDINSYNEISFVSHGADPYAQKIGDGGKIVNPKYAASRTQAQGFAAEDFAELGSYADWKEPKKYFFGFSNNEEEPTIPNQSKNNYTWEKPTNQTETAMNDQMRLFYIAQFKLSADATEEQINAKLKEQLPLLLAAQATLATTQTELTTLKGKFPEGVEVLTAEQKATLAESTTNKTNFDAVLVDLRAKTITAYNLTCGGADKADKAITTMIGSAPYETLKALKTQYETAAEASHSLECQDCHSKNIKRNSSVNNEGTKEENEEQNSEVKNLSNEEVRKKLAAKNRGNFASTLHGEKKEEAKK